MVNESLKAGDYIVHFKRELLSDEERQNSLKFLYMVVDIATNTQDGSDVVVYRALYPDASGKFKMFVRSKSEFYDEVDKSTYPDVKQESRFKIVSM